MKYSSLVLSIFFVGLFSVSLFSQTPTPTPTDTDGDVVKISTSLIQIDVTVTDKKGNIVTDLKPEDFEIYENGKLQKITNSSFVNLTDETPSTTAEKTTPKVKNALPIPETKLKPEDVRRTYAIAVDDLGLSFSSIYWVQQSLKKFINEQMQDGDLVAVIRTSGGIGALQSFTSDKRLLLAAVNKIRWNPNGRVGIDSFEPIRQSLQEALIGTKKLDKNGEETIRDSKNAVKENDFKDQANNFREGNISVGTLGALKYIVQGMKELPGRKAVMLLSEGFRIYMSRSNMTGDSSRVFEAMRLLADQANRSSVIFYTLDPRGLTNVSATAEDEVGDIFEDVTQSKFRDREDALRESQDSLLFLAYETGGIPFVNQNDLNLGLQRAINDQKGYYLVAYQPDEETFDPKKARFNKLTVKVKRPNLKIRYRSGFFGISEEKINERKRENPRQQLANALVSPFGAKDINIDLYSAFYNDAQNKSFIRSLVYIDPKDLKFTVGSDGIYRTKFDIIAMIFDTNGQAATNNINSTTLQFTKEKFATVQQKGIIYNLPVPLTKPGAYQFRVALRDSETGKIGAASQFIEIPNLDKKQLALSNLIIRNYSIDEWKKISANPTDILSSNNNNTLTDTVIRQFKRGSILTYFYEIYNAKTTPNKIPQLFLQTRLFRDSKLILEEKPSPISIGNQRDLQHIINLNAITLGTNLSPGDYALQVVIYDKQAKEKSQVASQSIDFELVQ